MATESPIIVSKYSDEPFEISALPEGWTKLGHRFIGWNTNPSASTSSADWSIGSSKYIEADTTLFAIWTPKKYWITFNPNGGKFADETIDPKSHQQDFGTAMAAPTVTRTGYKLTGWSPPVPSTVPANDATYTAQWQKITINGVVSTVRATATLKNITPADSSKYYSTSSQDDGYSPGNSITFTFNGYNESKTVWFKVTYEGVSAIWKATIKRQRTDIFEGPFHGQAEANIVAGNYIRQYGDDCSVSVGAMDAYTWYVSGYYFTYTTIANERIQ